MAGDGYSQTIDIGAGLLKVKATGDVLVHGGRADDEPGSADRGDLTVTDGDGDTATATVNFQVTDANARPAAVAAAAVDDDGVAGGNPASSIGDLDANLGDLDGPASSEATFSAVLGGSVGR